MVDFNDIMERIQEFKTESLTSKISVLEKSLVGANNRSAANLLKEVGVDDELMEGALIIKQVAGEINVIIHTLGILHYLPDILKDGEEVEYLSLGAGNTGKNFDLETNLCVAEFKFINWRGGAEVIRQNKLFEDFYKLAEYESEKEKYLFLLGLDIPLKFLTGQRALNSVLSKNVKMRNEFFSKYGERFSVVREYYEFKKHAVKLVDLNQNPYI